ncbi:hypothetical protein BRD00_07130 [Halobacteriales archaeon QS_8_69_26]|nr:MAG: hypothetical protein BRD00_07130 [Halobacteriales archaeon QS_8_69_26]
MSGGRTTFGVPSTESTTETPSATTRTDAETTTTVRGGDPGVDPVGDLAVPSAVDRSLLAGVPEDRRLVFSFDGDLPDDTTLTAGFLRPPDLEDPARVWMALRNDADRQRTFGFGPTPPFSGYFGQSPTGFGPEPMLVPDDDRGYARPGIVPDDPRGEGCWTAESVFVAPDVRTKLALGPGEAVVGEYALVFGHQAEACFPEHQVYAFRDPVMDFRLLLGTWDPAVAVPGESRFDRSVPSLPGVAGTAWYHTAADAQVYLEPRGETLSLPRDSTDFLLKNFSTDRIRIDEAGWRLYKYRDGRWFRVLPWETDRNYVHLPPGGESRVLLSMDNRIGYNRQGIVRDIGGGLYAARYGSIPLLADFDSGPLRVDGDDPGEPAEEEPRQAQAALVAVEGDPVGVEPDVPSDRIERDGGTVRADYGDGGESVFLARRASSEEGEPVRVIAEQANQTVALRNTLGFFEEDVQRVRLEASETLVRRPASRFGDGSDPFLFSYDDETFLGRVE